MTDKKNEFKIFLLTPDDKSPCKIVWADNEDDARVSATNRLCKDITNGGKTSYSYDGDTIYTMKSTRCEDVTDKISNVMLYHAPAMDFDYQGKRIRLKKNWGEDLEKFR